MAKAARSAIRIPCVPSIVPSIAMRRPFWSNVSVSMVLFQSAVQSSERIGNGGGDLTLFEELGDFKLRDKRFRRRSAIVVGLHSGYSEARI